MKKEKGFAKGNKIQFTCILESETFIALETLAEKESRPLAQMARLIIEKAVNKRKSVKPKEL